jgi:hypothetical protein
MSSLIPRRRTNIVIGRRDDNGTRKRSLLNARKSTGRSQHNDRVHARIINIIQHNYNAMSPPTEHLSVVPLRATHANDRRIQLRRVMRTSKA